MANPIDPATNFPRLGYLYELHDADLVEVPALLHVDEQSGLLLDISFPAGSDGGVGRWFGRSARECPEQLLFQDHEMDIHLFGVSVATQGRDARYEPGLGQLRAEFAVEDRDRSDVEYATVTAMQSEILGLHEFMQFRLTEFDLERANTGDALLRIAPHRRVEVGEVNGIAITLVGTTWLGSDGPNVRSVGETTLLITRSKEPKPLDEHQEIHASIRDFLALVAWKPLDFTEVKVQREDAPMRAMAGNAIGAAWRRLHSPSMQRRHSPDLDVDLHFGSFLNPVNIEAVGPAALLAWLHQRKEMARFIDPLLTLCFARLITPEIALMQTCIAAEALAYTQSVRAGLGPGVAAQEPFSSRLARLAYGQPLDVDSVAVDTEHWIASAAGAYNGVKHANRALPAPPLPTLIALTMIMVLRSQLLLELGTPRAAIEGFKKHQSWWGLRAAYESVAGWPAPLR